MAETSTQQRRTVTVPAPQVAYRGPSDTDAAMMRDAAWKLRNGYDVGGSNVTAAVVRLLDHVAEQMGAGPSKYEGRAGRPPRADSTLSVEDVLEGLANHLDGGEFVGAGQELGIEFARSDGDQMGLTVVDEAGRQHRFSLLAAEADE